jgi:hypothetical protein
VTHANCAVKTFADDIDETVTIVALQMKARMPSGQLCNKETGRQR